MQAPLASLGLVGLLVLSGCFGALGAEVHGPPAPLDGLLVAYGDSYTVPAIAEVPEASSYSWVTGADPSVRSIHQRLLERVPGLESANLARSGYRMHQLVEEVENGPRDASHVIIFLGINDACWFEPTTPAEFLDATTAGFDAVRAAHPQARVVVFSIPDLDRMWGLFESNPVAVTGWSQATYCRDFYAPFLEASAEEKPRERWERLNTILEEEAQERGFHFSDALTWPGWSAEDFSALDFFHPDVSGEARMAEAAWRTVAGVL